MTTKQHSPLTDRRQGSVLASKHAGSAQSPKSARSNRLTNVALVVGSVIISLVLAEVGARVYAAVNNGPPTSSYDFRLTRPPPYRESPFFSEAFMEEQRRQPGGFKLVGGGEILIPNDYRGRFYNVVDGNRRTTDQPEAFEHRILMFGGSTMYDAEVPDDFTISSSLQRLVNQRFPGKYHVVNYGVDSANARQQLARLETTDLRAGDVVVFYDGFNESYNGVYLDNLDSTIYDAIYTTYERSSLFAKAIYQLNAQLRRRSQLVREFFTAPPRLPDHMKTAAVVEDLANKTDAEYERVLVDAHRYVTSKDASFVHFLQPNLFSRPELTPYEAGLVDNHYLVFPGVDSSIRATYPLFRDTVEELRRTGVESFDLSSVLDARSSPQEEFYLDFVHVTEKANAKVADAILGGLNASLRPRP